MNREADVVNRHHAATDIACSLCAGVSCENRGEILHPHPTTVAGVEIDLGSQPFFLMRCRKCGFRFKHPSPSLEALLDCYRRAEGGHWEERPNARERQFDVLKAALERHAPTADAGRSRRVLDIGCFNGALLEFLGDEWEKHGVEPSAEAAAIAQQRQVNILGAVLDESSPASFYDAALAIDVLEHIPRPIEFFRLVARVLKPGGVFIMLTGDTDARSWRWQGSRYWYCSLPEHVSFYNRHALEFAALQCGMKSVEQRRMCHIRAPLGQEVSQGARNIAYGLALRLGWLPGRRLREAVLNRRAPVWLAARDHLLHVMRRGA